MGNQNKRGKLIVFEGLNGCGKGTHLQKLHNYIQFSGKAVPIFTTGEPNNFDENGKAARNLLKSDGDPYENALEAVDYFAKNRKTHCEIIKPLLDKGIDVISDRYYYSNLAYQHAQGVSLERIAEANENALRPDLTFIFNTTPEESLRRLEYRDGEGKRKFDSNMNFNKKVWNNYMSFGKILPGLMGDESISYIDAMGSMENTFENVKKNYLDISF